MIKFMRQITIEARTTIYLIIAEKMFQKINKNDEKYTYGREALDKCWQWIECKGILADDLYELIDSRDCYDITEFAEDENDMNRAEIWYALVDAVSYTIWQAYKNENAKYVPQAIEIIKDELIEDLIKNATDTGFFHVECIEKLRNYLSGITMERLTNAGWYEGRKIDIQDIKDLFKERGIDLFETAEKFLNEFAMLEITFQDPNPAFDMEEYIHFNPKWSVGDCLDVKYFQDLAEEHNDEIREKVIPVGETDRGNLILLITPSEKYYGYTDGCLVKFGDNTEEMLECLCLPKVPKIF